MHEQRHPDEEAIAWIYVHLGELADARGDYPAARAHLEEGAALLSGRDDTQYPAWVRQKLGRLAQHQGQWTVARAHYSRSLAISRREGHALGIAYCLEGLASVTNALGEPERAARLFGAAAALRETRTIPVPPVERADLERVTAAARSSLREAVFAAAWAAGHALPLDRAIAVALEEAPAG